MNSHARFAAMTARAKGYSFRSLDGDDAYLFEVSDGARTAAFPVGYATPYALNEARAYSLARDKAFAGRVMEAAGLSIIPSLVFFANERQAAYRSPGREKADALRWAEGAADQFPIFCKPNQGSKGEFAEIVEDAAGFARYLDRIAPFYDVILAQPLLAGEEYRVIVLDGAALCAYRKARPVLVGDGAATIADLLAAAQAGWRRAAQTTPLEDIRVVAGAGERLGLGDVLAAGASAVIEGRANRAAGGGAEALTDDPPAPLADIALASAAALGLRFAGVDIFDLSQNRDLSDLTIIEVNANPALETLEAEGRYDLIEAVWAANFAAAMK